MIRRTSRYTGWLLVASAAIYLLGFVTHAQGNKAFVGVWEETHSLGAKGEPGTGNAGMRRIFTADGFYSITYGRQCAGTPAVDKPLPELTKAQLLDRLRCVIAQDGSFTVDGDKLNISRRSDNNPPAVGSKQVMQWKVENGELSLKVLSDTGLPTVGSVTFYKRLK